ncbi:unnamed protein product [Calicophoron daubneyi]|uniref:Nucleolar protein 14 n=1 Tax=Calicophoron daubneyi TaxID=300641 RepID=A0AAV2TAB2_CALDB
MKSKIAHLHKRTSGGSKACAAAKRAEILKQGLRRIGKVGGLVDARLDARNGQRTDDEKSLRRHMVEKLRSLDEDNSAAEVKSTESIFKSVGTPKDMRDDFGYDGIKSDIVNNEFFSGGPEAVQPLEKFQNVLAEKIASSKLEKLNRIAENEEQRERLKAANLEWSNKIRFMLSDLHSIKAKPPVSLKAKKNQKSVHELLEDLASERRIPPTDTLKGSASTLDNNQISKIQSVIEDPRHGPLPKDEIVADSQSVSSKKAMGHLLRMLLRIQNRATINFVASELSQCQIHTLKDFVHCLLLAELVLEYCQTKHSAKSESSVTSISQPKGSGAFCPELPRLLTRMIRLIVSANDIMSISETTTLPRPYDFLSVSSVSKDDEISDELNVALADQKNPEQAKALSATCLRRFISVSVRTYKLYAEFLTPVVLSQLFGPMRTELSRINWHHFPSTLASEFCELSELIERAEEESTPGPLVANNWLQTLSANELSDKAVLKKVGLLPQLEPKFDEKLDARHPKKAKMQRILQHKIGREKRGVMRDIRRDSQYLAKHQLKLTKASDEMRNKKTQAIISSLRAVED